MNVISSSDTKAESKTENLTISELDGTAVGIFNEATVCSSKSSNEIENNSININNMEGIIHLLSHKGRISGYSNIVNMNYLYNDIVKNISKNDISNAKGMVFIFIVNEFTSMFELSDIMEKLHEFFPYEMEATFDTIDTKDLNENEIGYRILVTGIED